MTTAQQITILRFFAVDLTRYSSYEEVRLVVERSDPVPLRVPEFPYEPPALSVFATLLLGEVEVGADHLFSLEWVADGGLVEARREEAVCLPEDTVISGPFPISFVVNFEGLRFAQPGTCEARLGLDGEQLEALAVEVGREMLRP